jgi:3-dehydrosphinganine reductase
MKNDFEGKVVLVTGGSSGIGLATATVLAQKGAHVWLLARHPESLQVALSQVESNRKSMSQRCGSVVADVTNIPETVAAVAEVTAACGAPDILINSAGDVYPVLFQEMDHSIMRQTMELNYFGIVHVTHACLPSMIARRTGHIVNMSSVYGFLGGYGYSAYCASKFAVRGFSDVIRAELKPLGISVSIVFPQNTATPQLERENQLKSPLMKALDTSHVMSCEAVANAIVRGISRRQYVIIPGTEGKLLFWLSGVLGSGIYGIMDRLIADAQKKMKEGYSS